MRWIVAVILSLVVGLGIAWADEKGELLLKQRAIQAEMASIQSLFELSQARLETLPNRFKEKEKELREVQQQIQVLDAAEKKATEKPPAPAPEPKKK